MKIAILFIGLLIATVALSGCMQTDPEARAIALADQLPEVRLISKVVDNMQRADQCTFDKFYSGYKKIAEREGETVPEPTESQRQQIEAMIQQMGALAKRCQITLSKSAEKESENVYIVHYKLETIPDPECSMLSVGDAQVRVDLSTGKAESMNGGPSSQDMEQYEEVFDELGECAAITMIGFAQTGTAASGSEEITSSVGPGGVTPISSEPGPITSCTYLPQDDKDKCIRAMVLVRGEPASRCNEIADEAIKADCIANAPAN